MSEFSQLTGLGLFLGLQDLHDPEKTVDWAELLGGGTQEERRARFEIMFPPFPPSAPFAGGSQVGAPPDQIEVNGRVFVDQNPGDVAANITTGTHSVGASAQLPVIAGSREDPNGLLVPRRPQFWAPQPDGFHTRRTAFAVDARDDFARAQLARRFAA